ncbi:MAG: archaeosine biosynthesis radical SAM protein RaSEA [Methanoregulaceae archaeon]|nr:archaeosine biosynthesis radical SAM protein RaSEA [Methanoregulaceae archaeon]
MSSVSPERPCAAWTGRDLFRGQVWPSLTVILRTGGCAWSRCLMCSYRHERYRSGSPEDLIRGIKAQVSWVSERFPPGTYDLVKIYTSGSLFDRNEVPKEALASVAGLCSGKMVVAETRPEYVVRESLEEFTSLIDEGKWKSPLSVAIGLETSDDSIREKSIRKGFSFDQYLTAVKEARSAGAGVKTYLLLKPLFLTENEAIEDMQSSIAACAAYSDVISMNPCTVQRGTEMERYWRYGAYRPPYLWSVLSVLLSAGTHILCDPVGGGYERGPHNCGKCDREILSAIRSYATTGDRELLRAVDETECRCRGEWEYVLAEEMPFCMPLTR